MISYHILPSFIFFLGVAFAILYAPYLGQPLIGAAALFLQNYTLSFGSLNGNQNQTISCTLIPTYSPLLVISVDYSPLRGLWINLWLVIIHGKQQTSNDSVHLMHSKWLVIILQYNYMKDLENVIFLEENFSHHSSQSVKNFDKQTCYYGIFSSLLILFFTFTLTNHSLMQPFCLNSYYKIPF